RHESRETTALLGAGTAHRLANHVPRGLAGGDHRVAVLLGGHADIDEHRAILGERVLEAAHELLLVLHPHPARAECLGELDPGGTGAHLHGRVAAAPEDLLPLAAH